MLNPDYTLPSRKTLSKSLLPILYNEIYDYVKNYIKKMPCMLVLQQIVDFGQKRKLYSCNCSLY